MYLLISLILKIFSFYLFQLFCTIYFKFKANLILIAKLNTLIKLYEIQKLEQYFYF